MQRQHYQAVLASVWVLTICAAAIAAGVQSLSAFAGVAIVALVPPIVMQWFWRDPPQTISESIHEARR